MQKTSEWYAFVDGGRDAQRVTIERTRFSDCRVHDRCNCDPWVYSTARYDGVGWWPGVGSDEWIEYVPADRMVLRDGELWWRHDDGVTVHFTQLTKSPDPRRAS